MQGCLIILGKICNYDRTCIMPTQLSIPNKSCTASSSYVGFDVGCLNALDNKPGTEWVSYAEGIGSWISIDFGRVVTLAKIGYVHRSFAAGLVNTITSKT